MNKVLEMQILECKKVIESAQAVLITAGAGMGVDSGLPDFRGTKGFWQAYPPIEKLGLSFAEMANPKWFEIDPKLAWAFYGHRLNLYRKTEPHEGFKMLLELVKQKDENYFVYTSNVDGQFQKAGFDSEKIYEIHGSIHHFQCSKNVTHGIWKADDEMIEVDMECFQAKNLPSCRVCAEIARPNILMFGDWSWRASRSNNQEAKFSKWKKSVKTKKIVIIEIGAGIAIPSVRIMGEHIAKTYPDATLIRINPRDNNLDKSFGYSIPLSGLDGITRLLS